VSSFWKYSNFLKTQRTMDRRKPLCQNQRDSFIRLIEFSDLWQTERQTDRHSAIAIDQRQQRRASCYSRLVVRGRIAPALWRIRLTTSTAGKSCPRIIPKGAARSRDQNTNLIHGFFSPLDPHAEQHRNRFGRSGTAYARDTQRERQTTLNL